MAEDSANLAAEGTTFFSFTAAPKKKGIDNQLQPPASTSLNAAELAAEPRDGSVAASLPAASFRASVDKLPPRAQVSAWSSTSLRTTRTSRMSLTATACSR